MGRKLLGREICLGKGGLRRVGRRWDLGLGDIGGLVGFKDIKNGEG